MIKRASIKSNYFYNMTYQILNLILPLVTTPYISRVLGASNIGIYSYTYSIVSTFVLIGSLGIGTYGQREIATVNDDKKETSKLFWEILSVKTLSVLLSLFVYGIVIVAYEEYSIYFFIQIPYFVAAILDISWFYQGIENFKNVAIRNIVIRLLSIVLLFAFVKKDDDLIVYILILCASQILGNLTMWMKLPILIEKTNLKNLNLVKHIKPTFVYFIPTIAHQIYAVLDKTMLGIILNDNAENGYYEQAQKVISMATVVITSYTVVMRSRMTALFTKGDNTEIKRILKDSLGYITFISFPMTFGLAAIASNLVPWFFGEGYDKVTYILYVFCPYFVLLAFCHYIGTHVLTPSGRQMKSNMGQCTAAAVNAFLNFFWIQKWGAIGASCASILAELIILVFYLIYSSDYIKVSDLVKASAKNILASLIMFIVVYSVANHLPPMMLYTVLLIILGALIYLLILIVLREKYVLHVLSLVRGKINKNMLSRIQRNKERK